MWLLIGNYLDMQLRGGGRDHTTQSSEAICAETAGSEGEQIV